jgi:hypothetical protein
MQVQTIGADRDVVHEGDQPRYVAVLAGYTAIYEMTGDGSLRIPPDTTPGLRIGCSNRLLRRRRPQASAAAV